MWKRFRGKKSILALALLSPFTLSLIWGCKESRFGTSDKVVEKSPKDGQENPKKPEEIPVENDNTAHADDPSAPPADADQDKEENPGGDGKIPKMQQDCLDRKAGKYNFVMVFDNSGSQSSTDPFKARRDAANEFVARFEDYVIQSPSAEINISSLGFAWDPKRGPSGWVRLKDTVSASKIKNDFKVLTDDPVGGTLYSPVLKEATVLLDAINAKPSNKRERNYVVFLTDGGPNTEEYCGRTNIFGSKIFCPKYDYVDNIKAAVKNLHDRNGAATIAIAAGLGFSFPGMPYISDADEALLRDNVAYPKVGTIGPTHTGAYYRARTGSAIKDAFDKIFKKIAQCE